MARIGITFDDVKNAAEQLLAQDENPTVDRVRAALGGTGSKSTIAPLLRRWRSKAMSSVAQTPELPASLVAALKNLYADMEQNKTQQIAEHQAAFASQSAELELTIAQLDKKNQELDGELKQTRTLNAEINQANQHLQEQNQQWQIKHSRLESEQQVSQLRLQDQHTEIQQLHQQLSQLSAQFEHYQQASAQLRQQERLQADQKQQVLEHELHQLRQQYMVSQEQFHKVCAEANSLEAQCKSFEIERRNREQEIEDEQKRHVEKIGQLQIELADTIKARYELEQQVIKNQELRELHERWKAESDKVTDNLRTQVLDLVQERKSWNNERQDLLMMLSRLQQWQIASEENKALPHQGD